MIFRLRNKQLTLSSTNTTSRASSIISKPLQESRTKYVIHKVVPWIDSPLKGIDEESRVFSQRHEANAIELFFDLFFVANLATFTTYHAVTDWSSLAAYIGFFVIIWETWFQITLHDVRFARDSVYERFCKTAQMVAFVGFALVSKEFAPGTPDANVTNFKLLSWILFLTRILLAIQYAVVITFIPKSGSKRHFLPLSLNCATYVCTAIIFGAMTTEFIPNRSANIVGLWWGAMALETIAIMTTTMVWRSLSFKKTHLVERMGLLTLIVIGEGAIGTTKTISAISSKELSMENAWLIVCIVLILMFIWMFYFDHQPHGHHGTLREQVWALLHFPVHLAIVGIVEGAQQVLRSRYGYTQTELFNKYVIDYCFKQNLDGQLLTSKFVSLIDTFKLNDKIETLPYVPRLLNDTYTIGDQTGICSNQTSLAGADYYVDRMPRPLVQWKLDFHGTLYVASGTKLKPEDPTHATSLESFEVVYVYFFASMFVLMASMMTWLALLRKHRSDASDWISQTVRAIALIIFAVLLTLAVNNEIRITIMRKTPAVLPVSAGLLLLIVLVDRIGVYVANRRNSRYIDAIQENQEGEHGGYESHRNSRDHWIPPKRDEPKDIPDDPHNDSVPLLKRQRHSGSTLASYPNSFVAGGEYISVSYPPARTPSPLNRSHVP